MSETSETSEVVHEETTTPEIDVPLTTKNPKKVEQGKRLAMISKEAKERKMRARLEKEMEENRSWATTRLPTFIAVGSSCGFLFTLLYLYFRSPRVIIEKSPPVVEMKKFKKENKFEEL